MSRTIADVNTNEHMDSGRRDTIPTTELPVIRNQTNNKFKQQI